LAEIGAILAKLGLYWVEFVSIFAFSCGMVIFAILCFLNRLKYPMINILQTLSIYWILLILLFKIAIVINTVLRCSNEGSVIAEIAKVAFIYPVNLFTRVDLTVLIFIPTLLCSKGASPLVYHKGKIDDSADFLWEVLDFFFPRSQVGGLNAYARETKELSIYNYYNQNISSII